MTRVRWTPNAAQRVAKRIYDAVAGLRAQRSSVAVSIDRYLRDQFIRRGFIAGTRPKCRICVLHDEFLPILSYNGAWLDRK